MQAKLPSMHLSRSYNRPRAGTLPLHVYFKLEGPVAIRQLQRGDHIRKSAFAHGKLDFTPEVKALCREAVCADALILEREPKRRKVPSPHTLDGWSRAYRREGLTAFLRAIYTPPSAPADRRGAIITRAQKMPNEQLFVAGRPRNRGNLKRRMLADGLKPNSCAACGLRGWLGQPLSMALHHINGDRLDNRLENLELLCPNCHSQTDTYSGRNVHRRPAVAWPAMGPAGS